MRLITLVAMTLSATAHIAAAQTPADTTDPYLWLEDWTGDRAMSWVKAENARTTDLLESDPRFADFYQSALAMAQAEDRIPGVSFIGGRLYNFWQDATHIRGIWRSTTLESYRTAEPAWTTVLDLDALATEENANWVWKGVDCLQPDERRCLLYLSDGGEDAVTIREFDLVTMTFVPGGFALPKSKQNVTWMGPDTLLVAREWSPGEMTASGYPYILKTLARGQPLAAAVELFRGNPNDVLVAPATLEDATGHRVSLITRAVSFFESEHYIIREDDVARLAIPAKASPATMLDGQVVVRLSEPWITSTTTIGSGGLASFSAATAMATPDALAPVAIVEPGPRESVAGASATRHHLLVSMTDNVRGRVYSYTRATDGSWSRQAIPLPDNMTTSVGSVDAHSDLAFIGVTGFLTPTSVWLADADAASAYTLKSSPARFDASGSVVEQFEVASTDGTMVPYFVVHPKGITLDGTTPTILTAYGGFEVSATPHYDGEVGDLWLERGGAFVLANIRGGGEFGPAWHEAGLKTRRQVIYDDFAAVARDLIARGITSPRRLGIEGGSNGGLLMGVEMNQHPELWNAVQIAVPLLDMLRYEQIAAGASWVGEYGSVANPEERAFLASISPYHNLTPGVKYPMPFIWTTTKDDRVGPQHARKFAARMAEYGMPYLYYEVIEGGHGAGANAIQSAHTAALGYTYFTRQLMDGGPAVP
ncbi:MAG TPA: prolyl oligopeptidase family serine peptidase [Gemmatimonadales bacterium]|nr:prolyl oligopeptidase family serine peptidase [Gemmatimonadales bacterium]